MPNYRFVCSHCGKTFETETSDVKECPFCFWTSSVKREDELQAAKKQARATVSRSSSKTPLKIPFSGGIFLLKSVLFLIFLTGFVYLGYQLYVKWNTMREKGDGLFSVTSQDVKQIETKQKTIEAIIAEFSPEEKEILYGEVILPEKIEPSASEKQVLDHTVEFKTGWSEKLSSAMWTLEQYQQLIAEQEAFYKIQFARSYRKKLRELFETNYLPAGEAFKRGDLLTARNLWVASLAFPLYSKDIMKHRAVALTMLKPFINDTLAKISNLNQALVIKERRAQEEALAMAYQNLASLIAQGEWEEAIQTINQMKPAIDQLDATSKQQVAPPPYSSTIAMVDQDIQRSLADLLAPNPVSAASLLSLEQDLAKKKDVLVGLTSEQVKAAQQTYQDTLAMIQEERWQDALSALNTIHSPEILKNDAQAKVVILQKIAGEGFALPERTG